MQGFIETETQATGITDAFVRSKVVRLGSSPSSSLTPTPATNQSVPPSSGTFGVLTARIGNAASGLVAGDTLNAQLFYDEGCRWPITGEGVSATLREDADSYLVAAFNADCIYAFPDDSEVTRGEVYAVFWHSRSGGTGDVSDARLQWKHTRPGG